MPISLTMQLLRRDLLIFKREFLGKFFDTCFMFFTNTIVFGYFMPSEGLGLEYGPFLVIGAIASFGLFEVVGQVSILMADIDGERNINYSLTLPMPSWTYLCYIGIFWSLSSLLLTVLLFPIGKLLLYTRFDLSQISYLKLIPMFFTVNLFYGFFSLWLAGMIKGMSGISHLFVRIFVPMWMFGAYFYSWQNLYKFSPIIASLTLINPMVYIMEGMRNACLGKEGYLSYSLCFFVLWGMILGLGWHAVKKLKQRLDCI